jgi:hypothetical protein
MDAHGGLRRAAETDVVAWRVKEPKVLDEIEGLEGQQRAAQ